MEGKMALLSSLLTLAITDSIDTNPTITPVLDLSNIEQGVPLMNSLLSGSYGLMPQRSTENAARTIPEGVPYYTAQAPVDLTAITSRIDQMNERLINLGTRITNMKLVLDSGVVAGGVTDGVDRNLGRKMFYAERKN